MATVRCPRSRSRTGAAPCLLKGVSGGAVQEPRSLGGAAVGRVLREGSVRAGLTLIETLSTVKESIFRVGGKEQEGGRQVMAFHVVDSGYGYILLIPNTNLTNL